MSDYTDLKKDKEPIVYVLQELPGTRMGRPKFNIMGAQKYGKLKVLQLQRLFIIIWRSISYWVGMCHCI